MQHESSLKAETKVIERTFGEDDHFAYSEDSGPPLTSSETEFLPKFKNEYKVIALSILSGIAVVLIDAFIDYLFFFDGSFTDVLLLNLPASELYTRILLLFTYIGFGLSAAYVIKKFSSKGKELQAVKDELESKVLQRTERLVRSNNRLQLETVERKKAEDSLTKQLELTKLINNISSRFINVSTDDFYVEVRKSIKLLAWYFKYEQAALFLEQEFANVTGRIIGYSEEKKVPEVNPSIVGKIEDIYSENTVITIIRENTKDPLLTEFMEENKINSMMVIPLKFNKRSYGMFFLFSENEEKKPAPACFEDLLIMLKEIFINGIERLKNDEALALSDLKYKSLFENVPVGLYRTTPDGRIIDANAALAEMLGYESREDLLWKKTGDFYAETSDREKFRQSIEQNGMVKEFEMELICKDGQKIKVLDTSRSVKQGAATMYYEGNMRLV